MPLIKACLVPHSPLLIPEIGKINTALLQKTALAYEHLAEELLTGAVETIIIISPHGLAQTDYFTLNVATSYRLDFSEFGFLGATQKFKPDLSLIQKIKETNSGIIQTGSQEKLDYGTGVPLYFLAKNRPDLKIISIAYAENLDREAHWAFGVRLAEIIAASPKRIAVIASGDLSPHLKKTSPAGYYPKGAKFDNRIIELLKNSTNLKDDCLNLDEKLVKEADACGFKPLLVLLGTLAAVNYKTQIIAYQTDFGIGYLTADFILSD
jgi:AmmeMemoRadiSam system protein B